MKNLFSSVRSVSLLLASFCVVSTAFGADNTELPGATSATKQISYSYHTFASCDEMKSVTEKMLSGMTNPVYRGGVYYESAKALVGTATADAIAPTATTSATYSETNVQVAGIDEADTVKTDGKYIYSYQQGENIIAILDANTLKTLQNIRVPDSYYDVKLYVQGDTLILTATRSIDYNARWYGWYNMTQRGVIAVYNIADRSHVSLKRIVQLDGSISDSRLDSDGIMTVVGMNYFSLPPIYASATEDASYEYTPRTLIPNIYDSTYSLQSGFKTESRRGLDCTEIGAVLPDDMSSLDSLGYSPVVTTVLRFDTSVTSGSIDSKVIFSNNQQIHLSKDSLYLTTPIYDYGNSACPAGAMCKMIWNPGTVSTLIHRFSFDGEKTEYVYSHMIAGSPLSQYSMDEDDAGNFRIVTSESDDTGSTSVTILNPLGKVLGTLTDIASGENFQSARFIGDRLYLVTFEQIDPLFVIDLSDESDPKILGELKIPGYSEYLHPYDTDRLIGIGYDTVENDFGGIQNSGIKIDLYNVADVANPIREQSLTLGGVGSYSEVSYNPHVFVWDADRDILLLPATVIDTTAKNVTKSAFQGVVGVEISPENIKEEFRVTHITYASGAEEEWKKDCENYLGDSDTPSCVKLLDGTEYCPGSSRYVPQYCYEGATVETYLADHIWEYADDFINRALYIGDSFYTIGNSRISKWNFDDTTAPTASVSFKTQSFLQYISSSIR